ncbi:tol-pal system-associated acyl-CoA thioesterase [Thioalkalicoccus limnaeus]|uniref:Tol-pal system-associated acyl-CoA thioesterase n=1 Tax=Thioalkalicoccus limnaeus TaxID=120681 RepID=A0ABV4BCQ9_9GAMM
MLDANSHATFRWPVRVYYEDTDAGGVVYYANYLRFFERARTEWLRHLGFDQGTLRHRDGLVFAVRRTSVDYLAPARFDDQLSITLTPIRLGRASLVLRQEAVRDTDGLCCARAEVQVAAVQEAGWRPSRIPDDLLQAIRP